MVVEVTFTTMKFLGSELGAGEGTRTDLLEIDRLKGLVGFRDKMQLTRIEN